MLHVGNSINMLLSASKKRKSKSLNNTQDKSLKQTNKKDVRGICIFCLSTKVGRKSVLIHTIRHEDFVPFCPWEYISDYCVVIIK